MAKKSSDEILHIRLNYEEAVMSKKDILRTQSNLLEALKFVKRYHLIRTQELKAKEILYKKLKAVKTNINKLHKNLPKVKLPEILKHDDDIEKEAKKNKKEIAGKDMKTRDLERELEDINKKLMSLNENF